MIMTREEKVLEIIKEIYNHQDSVSLAGMIVDREALFQSEIDLLKQDNEQWKSLMTELKYQHEKALNIIANQEQENEKLKELSVSWNEAHNKVSLQAKEDRNAFVAEIEKLKEENKKLIYIVQEDQQIFKLQNEVESLSASKYILEAEIESLKGKLKEVIVYDYDELRRKGISALTVDLSTSIKKLIHP